MPHKKTLEDAYELQRQAETLAQQARDRANSVGSDRDAWVADFRRQADELRKRASTLRATRRRK